jgi:hypothetical protein
MTILPVNSRMLCSPHTFPQGRVLIDDVLTASYQETLQNAAEVRRFGQSIPDQMRADYAYDDKSLYISYCTAFAEVA